jgi:hypothetical protein
LTEDDNFKPMLDKIQAVAVEVTASDHVEAELAVAAPNDELAKQLNKEIQEGLRDAKGIVSYLAGEKKRLQVLLELLEASKVTIDGTNVRIKGEVVAEVIEKALKSQQP